MDTSLTPLAVASQYYRLVSRVGSKLSHFILDRLLRLSVKGIKLDQQGLYALRKGISKVDSLLGKDQADMRITPQMCDAIPADWLHLPQSRHDRVLLYLHGGGFCFRIPRIQRLMVARWCRRLGARALIPHYRLAPEHPYPAGPDDCLAAYRWLLGNGVLAKDIVICGDSAGGNLALVTLLRARDAGLPLPAAAVLLSPAVDFAANTPSMLANEPIDPMFSMAVVRWLIGMYLSEPEFHQEPAKSPITGDFAGLPALLIQVGTNEMLLDDARGAAAKAHAAGVPVALQIFEGMPHVFQYVPYLAATRQADDYIAEFLAEHADWKPCKKFS